MDQPLVTVLMPAYNASSFLEEAIESILNQTYKNIDFLIINDGSTDNSLTIINNYKDSRIRVISYKENRGIIETLNDGLTKAKGKYIARMDADDYSMPQRILKQVQLLENNPRVGIVGTYIQKNKKQVYRKRILNSNEIKARLFFDNILSHPTIMFRSDILKKSNLNYDKNYPHAEDYAFWINAFDSTDYALIPEMMLRYRQHAEQISVVKRETQLASVFDVHSNLFSKMGINPNKKESYIHQKIFFIDYSYEPEFLTSVENWLLKLKNANNKITLFPISDFNNVLAWVWFEICTDFASKGFKTLQKYRQSNLYISEACSKYYFNKFRLKNKFSRKKI
ncbi:MAG: glycosyltransferase [Bacteroidia bacterium]